MGYKADLRIRSPLLYPAELRARMITTNNNRYFPACQIFLKVKKALLDGRSWCGFGAMSLGIAALARTSGGAA